MSERLCSQCGNTYPLDKKHFRWKDRGDGTGTFTTECLVCRSQAKRASAERKKARREAGLRKIEEAGVELFCSTSARGGSNIPHSAEVIERVFQYFGGVAGFSSVVVKQYWDSPPGGTARNRLIETLCRLVTKNVESGGAKKPLSLWSEDELEDELNKRFQEAVASFKGTTINVEVEEPRRLTSQAKEASGGAGTSDAGGADADAVPARQPQGHPKRAKRKKERSSEALPGEPAAGGDPQVSGQ
jgi:hypothetical protein